MIYTPPPPPPTRCADAAVSALLQVAGAVVFGATLSILYVVVMVLA